MLISSLLWGICSLLDFGLLAAVVEVSKSAHKSKRKPWINLKKKKKIYIYIYIYVNKKNRLFSALLLENLQKKCSGSFIFALKHCECDAWLPVHPRSKATPLALLMLMCPLRITGALDCTHMRVGMLLRLPQCSDEWATIVNCRVLLGQWHLQCSKYLVDSAQRAQGMCSVEL